MRNEVRRYAIGSFEEEDFRHWLIKREPKTRFPRDKVVATLKCDRCESSYKGLQPRGFLAPTCPDCRKVTQ